MANNQLTEFEMLFSHKTTENGDKSFRTTGNKMLDILFMTEYYQKHLTETPTLDMNTEYLVKKAQLFSMFIRDPRFGLGRRDLGRYIMQQVNLDIELVVLCGRADDLWNMYPNGDKFYQVIDFIKEKIDGNDEMKELYKKWLPRYSSKDLLIARRIAAHWKMNKQTYGHYIKADTVENAMSRKNWESIQFDKLPSLAAIKYVKAFMRHEPERYQKYLDDVRAGKKELHVATTTVYDIYKNRDSIDPDLFFSKIEKISGNWIPVVDTSGSMWDSNDSAGKAMAIGHYLAKCSTYCPNQVLSFSSQPQLITLGTPAKPSYGYGYNRFSNPKNSQYIREIASMYTGDCSNTDFGAVMRLLSGLKTYFPEWIVVLSDMEFDAGSSRSKDATMQYFKSIGAKTKILWWNFNSRATTVPEIDKYGNCYMSGYNPFLLKFLEAGFNGNQFLDNLLNEYRKALVK